MREILGAALIGIGIALALVGLAIILSAILHRDGTP